jgi:oligoendopeptidase F
VRHTIAQKLGYENFVEVGYMRMYRTDYDAQMVKEFRAVVETKIVPIVSELRERQRRRLGLDKMLYYDESLDYNSGNAKPKAPLTGSWRRPGKCTQSSLRKPGNFSVSCSRMS